MQIHKLLYWMTKINNAFKRKLYFKNIIVLFVKVKIYI